ncbi:MAG: DUF2846 domain-containing protein [Phycisphaerales bacterium]|nr:DUF2846 domain-containing protein [Phycisphaerales bacterium]
MWLRRLPVFLFLTGCVAVSGCNSARVPLATHAQEELAREFHTHPTKGRVYCYRVYNHRGEEVVAYSIEVDGQLVTELSVNTFSYFDVSPGTHVLSTTPRSFESPHAIRLKVEPGRIYFVKLESRLDLSSSRVYLMKTDDDVGKRELQECKMATLINQPFEE